MPATNNFPATTVSVAVQPSVLFKLVELAERKEIVRKSKTESGQGVTRR